MTVDRIILATIAVGTSAVAIDRSLVNRSNELRADYWQSKYQELNNNKEIKKCINR